MFDYQEKNPFRVPSWRWERARTFREAGRRRAPGTEDEWTQLAFRYQRSEVQATDAYAQFTMAENYPEVFYAATIYRQRGQGSERGHPLRLALEARLLAGSSDAEIAEAVGIDAEVVECYEKLFFNVREKLRNTDYIMTVVIGAAMYTGLSERDFDLLWKLFGYLYGPKVLDAFITSTTKAFQPKSPEEVEACIQNDTKSAIRRKAAVAARMFQINNFTQGELLNVYTRFLELEKEGDGNSAKDFFLTNVQLILKNMPFTTDDDKFAAVAPARLLEYDKRGSELRSDELMAVAAGQELPPIEEPSYPELQTDEPAK